jgi:endonuclease G
MIWGSSSKSSSITDTAVLPTPPSSPPLTPELSSASVVARSTLVNPAAYFDKYGFPNPVHDIAVRGEFVSCFDRRMRNPDWVIEHFTHRSLRVKDGSRESSVFKEDTAIPELFRARLRDYFRSGYDRGHQAPAADAKFSQDAMDETFFLTNMCPQVGEGFNRDYWSHFENFCRQLTNSYDSVRIVTGPLYLPKKGPDGKFRVTYEVIGNPPNVAVPTHFFKIIIGEVPRISSISPQGVAIGAFVLPNEAIDNSTPLKSFYVPLDAIERASGVEFLPNLPVSERRDLCREVKCDIVVREFKKALPAPNQALALPGK